MLDFVDAKGEFAVQTGSGDGMQFAKSDDDSGFFCLDGIKRGEQANDKDEQRTKKGRYPKRLFVELG